MTEIDFEVIEVSKEQLSKARRLLVIAALYSQLSSSDANRDLIADIVLVDVAKILGIERYEALRFEAAVFDKMLQDSDWVFSFRKKESKIKWGFCNCGKEDCEGNDLEIRI
jgi:hypothetical protein